MHRGNEKDTEGRPYIEKYLLRKAFDTPDRPYLPDDCLWRQKEQFSDGVGYSWIDTLKAKAESSISDLEMKNAPQLSVICDLCVLLFHLHT
jgi:asparagine synthase (glutamine-hydrolysing)